MAINNSTASPLVSVLMTVYNRERHIAEAIDSILASTYKNWELIIVDDKSKDNSVTIAQSYERKDARIRVYVNDTNLGDYPNRNRAASYAKGKYLKYVDADDMIYPHGLEQLVFYMEQFPKAGYGLCSLMQDKHRIFPFQLSPHDAYHRHYFEEALFHRAPLSSIIKREAFEKVNGFSGKRMLGDFEMWHLLSQKYPVVLMPIGIVWYREHEEQEMSLFRSDPYVPFKYLLLAKELLMSPECPLSKSESIEAIKKVEDKMARSVLSAVKHHSLRKGIALKKASNFNWSKIIAKGSKEYMRND